MQEYSPLVVIYLSIFAEIIIYNSAIFCSLVESVAGQVSKQVSAIVAIGVSVDERQLSIIRWLQVLQSFITENY